MLKNIDKNLHFIIFMQYFHSSYTVFAARHNAATRRSMLLRVGSNDIGQASVYSALPCAATAAMLRAMRSASPKK